MSSAFAASITVLPGATSTFLPSISRFSIGQASDVIRHQASLVIDVVLEFVAEVVDEALDRQRCGVAQRTDRASGDVVGNRDQQIEVFVTALAVLDAVDDAPQPSGSFAARR